MNFEKKPSSLYPERPSANLEADLSALKKLLSGETPKIELSEKEKTELLSFENELGEELEKTFSSLVPPFSFHLDYFFSPEGRVELEKTFSINFAGKNESEIERFILENRSFFQTMDPKERKALEGRSESFSDKKLLSQLTESYEKNASLEIDSLEAAKRIGLILNPKKTLEDLSTLRIFRKNLKELIAHSSNETALSSAKKEIALLYKKRVNELLAEQFSNISCLKKVSNKLGEQALTQEENNLLQISFAFSNSDRTLSRYDKFLYGASSEKDVQGMNKQVDKNLLNYAKKIEQDYIYNSLNKRKLVEAKGLDFEKISLGSISVEEFTQIANETLENYGLLSSSNSVDYNPDRKESAPDGKWQFIARPENKVMSVDGKQKVVKSGIAKKSATEVFATLCAHEIDGHVLQHENKALVPLRLFKKIGAGRNQLFSEGGAMFNEDLICQELFGFRSIPHAHYVKSMLTKLGGGNYLDCVKSFFDSCQRITLLEKEQGLLDSPEKFSAATKDNLKLAINRAKRFFLPSVDLNNKTSNITKSKETVYLEQLLLLEKLESSGLEQLAFIGGANLPTLASLEKLGLLDIKKVKKPDFPYLKMWERIKDNYKKD